MKSALFAVVALLLLQALTVESAFMSVDRIPVKMVPRVSTTSEGETHRRHIPSLPVFLGQPWMLRSSSSAAIICKFMVTYSMVYTRMVLSSQVRMQL